MGRGERAGSNNSCRGQVWKRNVKCDDSDEDYMLEEDEADDQSDELESLVGDASDEEILGRFVDEEEVTVRKVVRSKSQKRSMGRTKSGIRSSKKRKRVGYDEDDEDCDDDDEFTPDELDLLEGDVSDEESLGSFVDEGDEDEMVRKAVRSKSRKKSTGKVKNGIGSSKKRGRVGYDEDDDDFDDEFTPDELELLVGDASDEESLDSFVDEEEEIVKMVVWSKSQKRSMRRRTNGIGSSKKRRRVGYDEEDEDYEDGDDDEFIPDELDFLDEEGLTSPTGKNKKKAQCSPKKKGSVKIQERKTGSNLPRWPQKKKRRGGSKSSKRKRMPVHGKRKAMPHSDSDFVSSESSDHEFTISEEELEQVREASDYCRRLSSNLRSSKKDGEDATHYQLRKPSTIKGKEKVDEIKNNVGKQVCGICLTEEGKNTVRGTLNCCSHFFCFGCIIEWSKVESRCPLCKQRFSTISKPARSATGIDLRDVVTHIPERDQVYQPSEEELRDYLIAYENVICNECHEGGDEALMLLCDLCDSPAHTYCVSLGREVPEGNWYCEGCRPSAVGFTSPQAQDLTPARRANNAAFNDPSVFENMAEIDLNITIPETPMTPVNQLLVSPRQPSGEGLQSAAPVSGMGVSTLSGRRRAHRLQYLLSSNRLIHTGMRVDRSSTPDWRVDFSEARED